MLYFPKKQYYLDESGNTGDVKNNSNTNFFVIAIYISGSNEELSLIKKKLRKELNINSKSFKWNKTDKSRRSKF